jgi:hypothetical protein
MRGMDEMRSFTQAKAHMATMLSRLTDLFT